MSSSSLLVFTLNLIVFDHHQLSFGLHLKMVLVKLLLLWKIRPVIKKCIDRGFIWRIFSRVLLVGLLEQLRKVAEARVGFVAGKMDRILRAAFVLHYGALLKLKKPIFCFGMRFARGLFRLLNNWLSLFWFCKT